MSIEEAWAKLNEAQKQRAVLDFGLAVLEETVAQLRRRVVDGTPVEDLRARLEALRGES